MDNFGEPTYKKQQYGQENQNYRLPSRITDLYGSARVSFIRKVYTILSMQILVTTLFVCLSIYSSAFFNFQISNFWLFWVALIMIIMIQIYLFCFDSAKYFPNNLICTIIFTFAQSYIVSFIASLTGKEQGNSTVLLASALTLVIVVVCTLYAALSPTDFTQCTAIVLILTAISFVLFIVVLFTDSPLLHCIYCGVGVFLFGIYLIIDTQMIIGGRGLQISIDGYYLAAMLLYIDIVTVFLYILDCIKEMRN